MPLSKRRKPQSGKPVRYTPPENATRTPAFAPPHGTGRRDVLTSCPLTPTVAPTILHHEGKDEPVDARRFDGLTRTVSLVLSRRTLAGALGLSALGLPSLVDAKKKKKRKKKKKVKFNEFGCVNVGGFCKNSGQCCSGICQGKKDKKKCKSHDARECDGEEDSCLGVPSFCTTSDGNVGQCLVTTGNAGYCYRAGECFDCTKDADCVAVCGPQAACVVCATCIGESEDATACVGPAADSCEFPAP